MSAPKPKARAPPRAKSSELLAPSIITTAEIFAPLGPIPRLFEGFGFYRGSVTLLAGNSAVGKTWFAQAILLAAAAGAPILGGANCAPLRVLHCDREQSRYLTCHRYQKLGRGLQITPADLGDRLSLIQRFSAGVDADDAKCKYLELLRGYDVVLFDSFRAFAPTLEENDSSVRSAIDDLNQIAEANDQSLVLIHHAKKGQITVQRDAIRGSTGILDAVSGAYVLASDGGTKILHHVKERFTKEFAPLEIRIDDTENDGVIVTASPVSAGDTDTPPRAERKRRDLDSEIVELLQTRGPQRSIEAIRELLRAKKPLVQSALNKLVDDGIVTRTDGKLALSPNFLKQGSQDAEHQ